MKINFNKNENEETQLVEIFDKHGKKLLCELKEDENEKVELLFNYNYFFGGGGVPVKTFTDRPLADFDD